MKLNQEYFNLFLYSLTAIGTIVAAYVLARLWEMPLKVLENKWLRAGLTGVLALFVSIVVVAGPVLLWENNGAL